MNRKWRPEKDLYSLSVIFPLIQVLLPLTYTGQEGFVCRYTEEFCKIVIFVLSLVVMTIDMATTSLLVNK